MKLFRYNAPVRPDRSGFAIVLVLAAVVLLAFLILAFFSNALLQRQISQSSAVRVKTDLLAQGAADILICDLKSEIAAGSQSPVTAGNDSLYLPQTSQNMVPSLVGSSGTNGLENLLKRSSAGNAFYSGGPSRASALASSDNTGVSRAISEARWNKHFFLPATSGTDATPDAATGFKAPDWVYLARDGSSPTTWSTALRTSKNDATSVVGRYAYAIYHEGGLLDVNAAGYPSTGSSANAARKASLAHADLNGLFEDAGFSQTRALQIVDALVTWRNEATLQGGSSAFENWAVFNPKAFLATANSVLFGSKSDRIFTSRQQLQNFLLENVASDSEQKEMQAALMYLGTYTRDLNQPSHMKTQSVNAALPGYQSSAPKIQAISSGGNNQSTLDAYVNPAFPLVRVVKTFTRNDGTTAEVGEPLVKERFALSRLAWLTYKGPSASRSQSDADIQTLINTHGISWDYLQRGTAANIQKYFGLRWVADSGSELGVWVYDVHNGSSGTGPSGAILRLGVTGDSSGVAFLSSPREADFFELLKASVSAGSKAKARATNGATVNPDDYQAQYDVSFDYSILQLGANIIAQSRVDGYGLRIRFNDGSLAVKEFHGVVNNPYIYRLRYGVLKIRQENPVISGNKSPVVFAPAGAVAGGSNYGASQGLLIDPGVSLLMVLPEIWNPHDAVGSMPSLRPTGFRLVADSVDPDGISQTNFSAYNQLTATGYDNTATTKYKSYSDHQNTGSTGSGWGTVPPFSRAKTGGTEITGGYSGYLHALKPSNTAIRFEVPDSTLFREPTLMARADIPAGSNMRMDDSVWSATAAPEIDYKSVETSSGLSYNGKGFRADATNPLVLPSSVAVSSSTAYLGVPIGFFPSQWVGWRVALQSPSTAQNIYRSRIVEPVGTNFGITYRLQYQDPTNAANWITYDTKYVLLQDDWIHNMLGAPGSGGLLQASVVWGSFTDPRSSRFGAPRHITPGEYESAYMGAGSGKKPTTTGTYETSETQSLNDKEWVDVQNNVLISNRPTANGGYSFRSVSGFTGGWYNSRMAQGMLSQNMVSLTHDGNRYSGVFGTDPSPVSSGSAAYYSDPDQVVRRASGAYASGTTAVGLPMASTMNPGGTTVANQSQSRPWFLNRPFRSVAELGYVFSGTPWKNLDFFTPESGDSGLFDVFCVNESENETPLVAGKVNLNTRQVPVLKAVLSGAYRDEQSPGAIALDSAVAEQIAQALVQRTTSTVTGKGPLTNVSELVGKWTASSASAPINGSASYDGFSKDVGSILQAAYGANSSMTNIQRYREAAIRPLASVGTTRTWNLMIDLVAEVGRFPSSAGKLQDFVVEGEQRIWVHVSIDRYTGEVLDTQTEIVKE